MVDKAWLDKQIQKYEKLAHDNYMNYQETGTSRYYSTFTKYEDFVSAFRMALSASPDHEQLCMLRNQVAEWRHQAERIRTSDPDVKSLLADIMAMARLHNL